MYICIYIYIYLHNIYLIFNLIYKIYLQSTSQHQDPEHSGYAIIVYVDGRQPRVRPRKRLFDMIRADLKLFNLSNEDANNRAV